MSLLLDTNILTRLVDPAQALHQPASQAVSRLMSEGRRLYIVPQNLYEFWVVATRPLSVNGLGLAPAMAHAHIQRFQIDFTLLDDSPAIYPVWERLVMTTGIAGKKAHDARLVAAMTVHPFPAARATSPADVLAV